MIKDYHIVSSPDTKWFVNEVHRATQTFQDEGYAVEVQYSSTADHKLVQYSALVIAKEA